METSHTFQAVVYHWLNKRHNDELSVEMTLVLGHSHGKHTFELDHLGMTFDSLGVTESLFTILHDL